MLPSLLTKITGQLFNLIAASYFGSNDPSLNKFLVANAIPELLTSVLLVGSLGTITIPILLSAKAKEGEQKFYQVYSSILNLVLLTFCFISIILIIFAGKFIPAAIEIVGSDVNLKEGELGQIANMMRVLILPQLILGISVFISTGLNVYDRYIVPQLSPLFFNLGRIVAVLVLVPYMDYSPWSLVIGVIIGSLLHLIIQIPLFLSLNFKYLFSIEKSSYLKEIAILGLPRLFVLASDHIGLAFNKFLAFAFVGGTASLNYAISLYLVVPSLFGYTFSYASYPTLSKLFIQQDYEKIKYIVHKTINEIFFLALPFVVSIMVLRVPIVRLVYGLVPGTNFQFDDTYQVAWVLLWFTFGMVFITARWFIFSLFYAAKDTLTPSIISAISLVSVIILSILLTNLFSHNPNYAISAIKFDPQYLFERSNSKAGVGGISLAMSITYTIEFAVLIFVFNKKKLDIDLKKIIKNLKPKFFSAGIMFVFMYLIYKTWNALSYTSPDAAAALYRGSTAINLIMLMFITVFPAFLIYYAICHLFKVEELKILRRYLNPLFRIGGFRIK